MGDTRRKLLESLKERNYVNYPIENEMLKSETDYIKNNYFRYLALVLRQEGEVSDGARALFQRMLVGAQMEGDMAVYMRQALEATIDAYAEFMSQLLGKPLRCRFLLDAILLACCDTEDEEVLELIAAYMESLKIRTDEAAYLCAMGKSILEQDSDLYWSTYMDLPDSVPIFITDEYTNNYVHDKIICDNNVLEIYFAEKTELDLRGILSARQKISDYAKNCSLIAADYKRECENMRESYAADSPNDIFSGWHRVVIHNATMILSKRGITFHKCDEVVLSSCDFLNGNYAIRVENVGRLSFMDCQFKKFAVHTILLYHVSEVDISSSRFEECQMEKSWERENWIEVGGVIHAGCSDQNMIKIRDTQFVKCGVNSIGGGYYSSAIISNCKCQITSSSFEKCWGYHYNSIDPENEKRTLFIPGTIKGNNKVLDSANFS